MSILLIEDGQHVLAEQARRLGIVAHSTASLASARVAIEREQPSVIVVDVALSTELALAVCELASGLGAARPYVLLVVDTEDAWLEQAISRGADDYIIRSRADRALKLRLMLGARVVAARRGVGLVREDLLFHATHDGLTGVWNKAAIVGCVYREIARAVRGGADISVLMCDLDYFKAVNDQHGHPTGDDVLRGVSARVQTALRPYDFVGRYGGEEFLVVLPGCDGAYAREVAERIRTRVRESPIACGEKQVSMTCSIGSVTLSELGPSDVAPNPSDLLDLADQLLYRAKTLGRDRVVSASELRHGKCAGR